MRKKSKIAGWIALAVAVAGGVFFSEQIKAKVPFLNKGGAQ